MYGRRAFGTSLALLAVAPLACVSKPTLKLHSARIESATPMGVGLMLMMKVTNDNSFDVQVRNVRVNVVLANRFPLPPIQYNPARWLPADGTTLVPVPVVIPWPMIAPLLGTTVGSVAIFYRCTGYADVTAIKMLNVERNDYPIDETGSVSRAALVMAAGQGVFTPTPY